jgi:phosphoglycolate phosphatase-like HAD superfamily hydrolase
MTTPPHRTAVLLDLDGTLIDSCYVHVLSWAEAFQAAGYDVAMADIHAAIGMGGDRLVPWLLGGAPDGADEISADHKRRFLDRSELLRPTAGAVALIEDLERRRMPFVIATSAGGEERSALLGCLGREDLPTVDSGDVESSKPAPDPLLAARDGFEERPDHVVMVGDAPWDAMAAVRAGFEAIAVRCGGFGDTVLASAGFSRIVDAPRGLVGSL